MSAVVDAVYQNGVFRPATPPDLPDGTPVRLTVVPATPPVPPPPPPTGAEVYALIQKIIAKYNPATDNPDVTSENVDQILYGGPNGAR
jgi:predicted DNA-binding antitoxin AbrB/MazE fold protein